VVARLKDNALFKVPTALGFSVFTLDEVLVLLTPIKQSNVPSLLLERYPVEVALPENLKALVPVPSIAIVRIAVWLADVVFISMIFAVVLLAEASACKKTIFPVVNVDCA
jgi:hypothetical protein